MLKDRAAEVGVKLDFQDENWSVSTVGQTMAVWVNGRRRVFNRRPGGTTKSRTRALPSRSTQDRIDIPDVAFNKGLRSVRWPGRFKLKSGPLVDLLREGQPLIDGGQRGGGQGHRRHLEDLAADTDPSDRRNVEKSDAESFLKPLGTPTRYLGRHSGRGKHLAGQGHRKPSWLLARAADGLRRPDRATSVGPNGRILV